MHVYFSIFVVIFGLMILLLIGFFQIFEISPSPVSSSQIWEQELELVYVQAIWRHGDRAAQHPLKNDKFQEVDWKNIGSGIEELTYKGIRQHIELGRDIRKRYVDSGFLPEKFDKNLIKFRSTNRNRTILSAEANFLGMYPNEKHFEIFVPKDYSMDCVNNVMCKCERRDFLKTMAKNLEEYKNLVEDPKVVSLFSKLSKLTGESINTENFWRIPDSLRTEYANFPKSLFEKNTPWYSEELMMELEILNSKINKFTSGLYHSNSKISQEIKKLRSGPLISEMFQKMEEKIQYPEGRPEKYYAYSSHDMTLDAFLISLNLQNLTSSEIGGWPSYATSLFIELFVSTSSAKTAYFRIIYRNPEDSQFLNITPKMCHGAAYCNLENFRKIRDELKIDLPIHEYCKYVKDLKEL